MRMTAESQSAAPDLEEVRRAAERDQVYLESLREIVRTLTEGAPPAPASRTARAWSTAIGRVNARRRTGPGVL